MPETAIIAALEREVAPLLKIGRAVKKDHEGHTFTFHEQRELVIVCGGIGAEPARRAAEATIALYHPAVLNSVGFAGALVPDLHVGDIVVPSTVINARDGSRIEVQPGNCVLLTFASTAAAKQKATLAQAYAAHAMDMEAAAVAAAACAHGLKFRATKVISDNVDFEMPNMDRFIGPQGTFQTARFLFFTALHPWLWPGVLTLARNTSKASQALATYLLEHGYQPAEAKAL